MNKNLDATSLSILKEIFERALINGEFVAADDYRVERNDLRPLIDRLEQRRFLLREGQAKSQYRVSLAALIAIDSNDAKLQLGRCAGIFGILQDHYRNPGTRPKQKFLSELAAELQFTDSQIRNAVRYIKDSGHWVAGGSNELAPPDQAWLRPNEHILNYDSFDDVLHEVVEAILRKLWNQ